MLSHQRSEISTIPGRSLFLSGNHYSRRHNLRQLAVYPHNARVIWRTEKCSPCRDHLLLPAKRLQMEPFIERHRFSLNASPRIYQRQALLRVDVVQILDRRPRRNPIGIARVIGSCLVIPVLSLHLTCNRSTFAAGCGSFPTLASTIYGRACSVSLHIRYGGLQRFHHFGIRGTRRHLHLQCRISPALPACSLRCGVRNRRMLRNGCSAAAAPHQTHPAPHVSFQIQRRE